MAEPTPMLDLEERLCADERGELRRSLIEQLEGLQASLLARRRRLSEPEVHRRLQAALDAVEAAIGALRTLRVRGDPPVDRWTSLPS